MGSFNTLTRLEQKALLELLKIAVAEEYDRVTSSAIRKMKMDGVPALFVEGTLEGLAEKNVLERTRTGEDTYWELHRDFAEEAYSLCLELNLIVEPDVALDSPANQRPHQDTIPGTGIGTVPAADRFVSLNHNSPEYTKAEAALDELTEAIRGSNDLFADPDQKLAVLSEMDDLRTRLKGPVVRAASIWYSLQRTGAVGWLATEAGAGLVRDLAVKAFHALATFLTAVL
ncbi:MAG TPA: hypothetical protein VGL95_12710 [Acetobacteraceae bacterium]